MGSPGCRGSRYAELGAAAAITGRVIDTQATLGCMVDLVERHPAFSSMLKELEKICIDWNCKDPIWDMPTLG